MRDVMSVLTKRLLSDDIDFVAFATTPWHAVGVDSFLCDGNIANELSRGLVVIMPHEGRFLLGPASFLKHTQLCIDYQFVHEPFRVSAMGGAPARYARKTADWGVLVASLCLELCFRRRRRKPFYVLSPYMPSLRVQRCFAKLSLAKRYSPHHVVIDEGLGSYVGMSSWVYEEIRLAGCCPTMVERARAVTKIAARRLSEQIAGHVVPCADRHVFRHTATGLRARAELASSYVAIFKRRARDLTMVKVESFGSAPILFIGQPWTDNGALSVADEMELLVTVARCAHERGKRLVIKPHPREDTRKYGELYRLLGSLGSVMEVTGRDHPAEALVAAAEPEWVVGYNSTSMLVSSIIMGLPTLTIMPVLLHRSKMAVFSSGWHSFARLAGSAVSIAHDPVEVSRLLLSPRWPANDREGIVT